MFFQLDNLNFYVKKNISVFLPEVCTNIRKEEKKYSHFLLRSRRLNRYCSQEENREKKYETICPVEMTLFS